MSVESGLLKQSVTYKPFRYPWAYEAWSQHEKVHWLPEEVPLGDDVADWRHNLDESEKNLITQIFRFFTQSDVEVSNNYNARLNDAFGPTEVQMMLSGFAARENIHVAAYSHLLDTLGLPETEYSAFLEYKEMRDKWDYLQGFDLGSKKALAKNLAVFGAFTEGLALFASFAMLMNFPRFNKMKGMGQIVAWSVRDETLHCVNIIKLFRTFIEENRRIWNDELKSEIYQAARDTVHHEDAFIDLAFEMGPIEGLTPEEMKQYIRYIADRRLIQLGLKANFGVSKNPLPWMDTILNGAEFVNFFENRVTEYSRAATKGTWDAVFAVNDQYVGMYTKSDCPWCEKAKELLIDNGIDFDLLEVIDDPDRRQALYDEEGLEGDKRTMPMIFIGDDRIGGYQELVELLEGR